MNILEKEIEDVIWHGIATDKSLLSKRGLQMPGAYSYIRQLDLGSYGVADIVGFSFSPRINGYRSLFIHLLELKKDEVNRDTFFQAIRYCKAIQQIASRWYNCTVYFRIDLIGKTVDTKTDFIYLADIYTEVSLYSYRIDLVQGITFTREWGYSQTNERLPCLGQFSDLIKRHLRKVVMSADGMPY